MKNVIVISETIYKPLRKHLFQSRVEQGAFLFARTETDAAELRLIVENHYLVPARGWEVQMEVYLQMRDSERAKIMKRARDKNLAAIDCHSHPGAGGDVWFSPSDVAGITEFAQYARWKLVGKPFAAVVWGEESLDAVIWQGEFTQADRIDDVRIIGKSPLTLIPNGSWFESARGKHRFSGYE
jgi:hypothetical protein